MTAITKQNIQIQIRRDSASDWTTNNPTLLAGEMGYETDTGKMKIGDGSTAWTSLGYFAGSSGGGGAPVIATYDSSTETLEFSSDIVDLDEESF